ncbi:excinuclease ABC subunit B [Vibrio mediterranei AK1]|nr:excinuclease ABC subunit B [Vibrio mediterranei AK1]
MSQVRVPQGEPNSKKAVSKDAAFYVSMRRNSYRALCRRARRPRSSPAGEAKFQKSRVERRGFLRFNATKLVPSFISQSSPPASESLRGSQIPEKPCRKTRRFTFQCDETRTELYVAELTARVRVPQGEPNSKEVVSQEMLVAFQKPKTSLS